MNDEGKLVKLNAYNSIQPTAQVTEKLYPVSKPTQQVVKPTVNIEEERKKIEDEKVDEALQSQLNEALQTVQYLRDQLNEVNLLNAKLLYTNKIFNSFNLDQKQKLKVVETFDLAKSIREVKLSYTILSESYSLGASVVKKTNTTAKTITEGLASKPVASTAPAKEVIVENSNVMASRFQKLAGIKR